MRTVDVRAASLQELEEYQDRAIALAKSDGEPVCCNQYLRIKPNEPCLCGSGKKWKKCCVWEDRTQVTFYPPGWRFGQRATPLNRLLAIGISAIAETWGR